MRVVAFGAHIRRPQQRPQPLEAATNDSGIVGAHDAAAARQRQRFDDARETRLTSASARGSRVDRRRDEPGHRQAGVAQPLARQLLVAARRPRLPAGARADPAPRAASAAITVGRSPTASTPSIGGVWAASTNRARPIPLRRRIGSGSRRRATGPRACGTDRSQTPDRRRAARPRRQTRASDIRWSSREDQALSASDLTPDRRPARYWAPLNSTKAR